MKVLGLTLHFRDKKKSANLASFSKAHRYLELSSDQKMDFIKFGVAFTAFPQTADHSKINLVQGGLILPTCILEFIQ